MSTPRVTLLTGGARSGKSSHALKLALACPAPRAFIATAVALDEEMVSRIARHKAERAAQFVTVEAPHGVARALRSLPSATSVAVIDCLTVWLGNLMHRSGMDQKPIDKEVEPLLESLRRPPCNVIVVTNEVGMGIVPENALARRFRDVAGGVNRAVAAVADEVLLMCCGIPMRVK